MKKPDSLRQAITAMIPHLGTDPERLQMFLDKGRVVQTAGVSLSFEYRYSLVLILQDFPAGQDATLFFAICHWLRANNEWELLQAYAMGRREGIAFEVDVLDHDKVDLQISLDLSEQVRVTAVEGGGWSMTYVDEPSHGGELGEGPWPAANLVQVDEEAEGRLVPIAP